MEAKIESLTSQVKNLTSNEPVTTNTTYQSIYLYIAIISLIILLMLIWIKPSFITYKDEKEIVQINKTRLIGTTAVLSIVVVGGGYWYLYKK